MACRNLGGYFEKQITGRSIAMIVANEY